MRAGIVSAERQAELAAGAGARVVRLTFDWRFAERQRDAYDFQDYDRIYRALTARGLRPLWIVMYAPRWAWDRGVRCTGDCRYPPSRDAEREWAELLALVARRYPRSAGIELWNEPNLIFFWRPRADPARYVRLMRAGYRAVKRARPGMPVAGGALSNKQVSENGSLSLESFLEGLYESGGRDHMDALSVHAYPANRSDPILDRSLIQVLDAREEHGDRKPIWITEVGATTTGTKEDLRWSERQQAQTLATAYERLRRVPGVRMVLVHTLLEPAERGDDPEAGYGVARADGTPKPAYCVFARKFRTEGVRC